MPTKKNCGPIIAAKKSGSEDILPLPPPPPPSPHEINWSISYRSQAKNLVS